MHDKKKKKRKKIKLKIYHFKDTGTQIHSVGLSRQTLDEEGGENESKSHRMMGRIVSIVLTIFLIKLFKLFKHIIFSHCIINDILIKIKLNIIN